MVGHLFIFFLFTFLKIKVELIYNVMATFLNRGFKYRSAFLRGPQRMVVAKVTSRVPRTAGRHHPHQISSDPQTDGVPSLGQALL